MEIRIGENGEIRETNQLKGKGIMNLEIHAEGTTPYKFTLTTKRGKGRVHITTSNQIMIDVNGRSDFPVKHDNGLITYDNPYLVPKYVRKLVVAAFGLKLNIIKRKRNHEA